MAGSILAAILLVSVARADNPVTSVPNQCTSAGGTGAGCGTDAQCVPNAYATKCVQLVVGDPRSRHCEIPCESPIGTAVEALCSLGETCTTAAGDGHHYCRASRFRMDLNLADLCITDFLTGRQPTLGTNDQCSLEANLNRLLDQNGDGLFDVFDMDLCIQALLDEPACDPTTGTCPADDLVFCTSDADCGGGLHCDMDRNACERVCGLVASREMGFADIDRQCAQPVTTCDYDKGSCVPVDLTQTTCQVDRDCPSGAYCFLGQCAPLCYRSIDCPGSDWYCTDNNRCRTLPSPNATPGFVFIPKNYALLFAQPAVRLNDVQTDSSVQVLIMDLITKRQVATNPSVSFGYRLEVVYSLKDDPKCRKDPAQWSVEDRGDCIVGDDKHFVTPVAPFGTVFAVGNPSMPVRLDVVAASHLTPGKYSANVRAIFENGSSDAFQVLYEKTTPSGEYTGTFQVTLGGADNSLAPSMPLNLAMRLRIQPEQKTWVQLLADEGINATSSDFTDLSAGYVVKGQVHGNETVAFADTTAPTGANEIPLRGIYSPQLGFMRLLWIVDLPADFCVDENGVCPTTGSTTNLSAHNVFGRRIRRLVQLFGTYDNAGRRFFGIYREALGGLIPQATDLTLDGAFLLSQTAHDESDFTSGALLPTGAPATVAFPAGTAVAAELDKEIAATCDGVTDGSTAKSRFASKAGFTGYVNGLASGGAPIFPDIVSFEDQISDALLALGSGADGASDGSSDTGGTVRSRDALTIYDFLSGRITICGTDTELGPGSTPTPGCIDEKAARCGLALYRRAIANGWTPAFPNDDGGNHQLFCSAVLATSDCGDGQSSALLALHEHNRFDQELAQARKFQADHDLSDAFFALYKNRVNPFGRGAALSFKAEKLESAVQRYDELLVNMVGTAPTRVMYGWPVGRFVGGGSLWMQQMEAILTDRLNALQQLVDLRRRVLEASGLSTRPLARHLAQIEYLVNVYLLALQRQWAGPNFTYDGIGDKLLQRTQSILLQLDENKNPLGISANAVFFENASLDVSNWQNYRRTLAGDDGSGGLLGQAQAEIGQAVENLKASLADVDTFERSLAEATGAYDDTIQSLCGPTGAADNICAQLRSDIVKAQLGGTMTERKCLAKGGKWNGSTCSGEVKCESASSVGLGDVCADVTKYFTESGVFSLDGVSDVACPWNDPARMIKIDGVQRACAGGEMGALLGQKADLAMQLRNLDIQIAGVLASVRNMTAFLKAKNDEYNKWNTTITALEAVVAALELAGSTLDKIWEIFDAWIEIPDCTIIAGLAFGTNCPGHITKDIAKAANTTTRAIVKGILDIAVKGIQTAIEPLNRAHERAADVIADKRELEDTLVQLQGIRGQYDATIQSLMSTYAQMAQVQLSAQAAADGRAESLHFLVDHLVGRETGSVLVGNYLVSKSAGTFRQALDVAYRTVMAFSHRYNLSNAQRNALISDVYRAITVEDLQEVVRQLDNTARDYCGREAIDCDAFNNLSVMRISLRDTLFPTLHDVVDPTTGSVVTKGQQFHNVISEPPFLKRRIVGTHTVDQIELPFVIWLQEVGESGARRWMVNPLECNHTLDWDPRADGSGHASVGNVAVNFTGSNLDPAARTIHYELARGSVDWLRTCHPEPTTIELGTAPILDYPIRSLVVGYAPQSQFGQESRPPTFFTRSTNLTACLDSSESGGAPQDPCWQFFARDRSVAAPDWKIVVPLWIDGGDAGNAWIAGEGLPDARKPVVSDIVLYLRYRTRPISEQ